MSADAKEWKKKLLREKGVTVMEYEDDYSLAVEEGRKQAALDENTYFIDDENSRDLFLGYAVAAIRLKNQLEDARIAVDEQHPLFVYLPCGVGGGPGGVAFGLKLLYGEPCMLLGLATELHDKISVGDIGLDNVTEADGLAVGRPSGFVGKTVGHLLSGCYTVSDRILFRHLGTIFTSEGIFLEPSAAVGLKGPVMLTREKEGQDYIRAQKLCGRMKNATHLAWATGGSMVPEEMKREYLAKAKG